MTYKHVTVLAMNSHIFAKYFNLEIAVLSDAQYLKFNLLLRAEICSSTVHMPKYLQISWYTCLWKGHRTF